MSTIDVLNMFTSYFLTLSLYCLILGRFHPVKSDFFFSQLSAVAENDADEKLKEWSIELKVTVD